MAANLRPPTVVRVSQKGQATIPKMLREEFGIEAPGEVFVYSEDDRLIIEPVPTFEELHGIHAGDHDPGDVLAKVRAERERERQRETERVERLRPSDEDEAK
jgi:AbrB family looped-hinge helix DNA binding protein